MQQAFFMNILVCVFVCAYLFICMSTSINSGRLSLSVLHVYFMHVTVQSELVPLRGVKAQRRLGTMCLHQYACCKPIGPQGEELVCDTHGFPALISLHLRTLALTKAERYRGTTEQTEQGWERERGRMLDRKTGRING